MTKILLCIWLCLLSFSCEGLIRIGLIGDSVSLPWPVIPYLSYSARVQKQLEEEGHSSRWINASQGGSTTETALSRLKEMCVYEKPDILVISLGINDGWSRRPYLDIFEDFSQTIQYALSENILVLLGAVDFIPEQFENLTKKEKIYFSYFVFIFDFLQAQYPEVIKFPFLTWALQYDQSYHTFDHVHLNAKGHEEVANSLYKVLLPSIIQMK